MLRIDHVAHPCHNPRETHRFYTTVLGLHLVQAYADKDLMLVYALPDGGHLVFSTGAEVARAPGDDADWQYRHIGLTVSTRAELDTWLRRLREHGVRHQLVDDERIYFSDPDGVVLELEVAAPVAVNPTASDTLARWLRASH